MNLRNHLAIAIRAALEAGDEILSVYEQPHEVEIKSDNSPLTIADRKSHLKIIDHLQHTQLPVLSEEGKAIAFETRSNWDLFWMVDPLDGTKEFIKKNGEFTVNIALIEKGKAVAGVIYAPVTDTLWFGSVDTGSFRITDASTVDQHTISNTDILLQSGNRLPLATTNRPFTVVASRSHLSPETEALVDELRIKHPDITFVSKGSSLKICLVAEGSADIYPRLAPTMEWDTAAGQAIAENAGCKMINALTGSTVIYNKEQLLNPHFIVERLS